MTETENLHFQPKIFNFIPNQMSFIIKNQQELSKCSLYFFTILLMVPKNFHLNKSEISLFLPNPSLTEIWDKWSKNNHPNNYFLIVGTVRWFLSLNFKPLPELRLTLAVITKSTLIKKVIFKKIVNNCNFG